MAGGGAKKGERRGGRQKGTQNKLSADIKKAIELAFTKAGAAEYLHTVAQNDPRTFCTLLGKVLPTQIERDPENPIGIWYSGVPRAADKKR